ncbi:hypothetical protein [Saccharicrinis sp. GN24d3]|uniref:hypothetical protein n=1 Tax=Saccharicrinis sp. GN24d3 TaxID=3458416 RepID=UPI004037295C
MNSRLLYRSFVLPIATFSLAMHAQRKIYLSGEDAATAVNRDFKIDHGGSGVSRTTIPVPSNWEAVGFGFL